MTRRDLFSAGLGAVAAAVLVVAVQQWMGRGTTSRPHTALTSAPSTPSAAASGPAVADDSAWRTANANLAETVRLTHERLEQNEADKKLLEHELEAAQAKLAASEGDGGPQRNPFDLTPDDWKELAKKGAVKARYPCGFEPDWHVSAAQAQTLGLSPADVAAVERAYMNEQDRLAGVIQAGCAKVLASAELARRLGNQVCAAVVGQSQKDDSADLQLVSNVRAGNIPMPPPDKIDPFAAMLLAVTESEKNLQADLGATFGADDAHRLAFSDELGSCSGTWGNLSSKP